MIYFVFLIFLSFFFFFNNKGLASELASSVETSMLIPDVQRPRVHRHSSCSAKGKGRVKQLQRAVGSLSLTGERVL